MRTATVPLCQHLMDNATRCRCPAMSGKRCCYTHQRAQARIAKKTTERARQRWFETVSLQNARSVQRALSDVVNRLLRDEMDSTQAGRLLYKLQTASIDLRRTG